MAEPRQLIVAVVAVAVALQAAAVGVGAQTAGQSADDVYVSANGDAVLVYDTEPSPDAPKNVEFGAHVAENLVYGLVTDPVEGTPEVRGRFTAEATPTAMLAEGSLSVPSPEAMRAFTLDISSESTEETYESDISVDTTLTDTAGITGFVDAVTTSGNVTMAADRLTATADLDVRANVPLGASQSLSASITEDGGDYQLVVDWSRPVPQRVAEQWRNRDTAERVLRGQYQAIAGSLGGSATVTIDRISVSETETGFRLDQAYSVRLTGIDSGLESIVRTALAENPRFTDGQVDRLATAIAAVDVRQLGINYTLDGRDLTGEVSLDVRGYDELALAYFEIAQAVGPGTAGDVLDRARAQFEAQQAADLEQRFTWAGNLSHPESGVVRAQLDAQASAANWATYVDELQSRDVPFISQTVAFTGELTDGRLAFNGSVSMSGDRLFDVLTQGLPTGEEMPAESAAILEGLRTATPEKAKMNGSYGSDGLRLEAGAKFANLSQLRDALAQETDIPRFSEVVGRANQTGGETIVRVPGAVASQPTEAAVRELAGVSEATNIHMPGEWDREFPSMDVERARTFLADVGAGSSGPGFGPVVTVLALLAAGLWAARRE